MTRNNQQWWWWRQVARIIFIFISTHKLGAFYWVRGRSALFAEFTMMTEVLGLRVKISLAMDLEPWLPRAFSRWKEGWRTICGIVSLCILIRGYVIVLECKNGHINGHGLPVFHTKILMLPTSSRSAHDWLHRIHVFAYATSIYQCWTLWPWGTICW